MNWLIPTAAHRDGLELWAGNGAFFCEIRNSNYFGLFWRHYVWWAAARAMTLKADAAYREQTELVPRL